MEQKACVKNFYFNAANTGVQMNGKEIPDTVADYKIFEFLRPFIIMGLLSRNGVNLTPLEVAGQTDFADEFVQLQNDMMQANRDGVSENFFVNYTPGAFSQYMNNKLNEDLLPLNEYSFLWVINFYRLYWKYLSVATVTDTTIAELLDMVQRVFKSSDLSIMLPNGKYEVATGYVFANPVTSMLSETYNIVPITGDNVVQTNFQWENITGFAPLTNNSKFFANFVDAATDADVLAIDSGLPAYANLKGPRFEDFPGDPYSAIAAWLGVDDVNNLFRQLGAPAGQFITPIAAADLPSPAFGGGVLSVPDATPYKAKIGTKIYSPYNSGVPAYVPKAVAFIMGGGVDFTGTPLDGLSTSLTINAFFFYDGGQSIYGQLFDDIAAYYSGASLGAPTLMVQEIKSIE